MMHLWTPATHSVTTLHTTADITYQAYFEPSCDDSAFPPTKTNRVYLLRAAAYELVPVLSERGSPLSQRGSSHQAQPVPGVWVHVLRFNLPVVL